MIFFNLTLTDIAIGFVQSSYKFDEGSGDVVIRIHKEFSRISEQNLTISIQLSSESKTATEGVDFTFDSMSYVFLPSDQEMDIPLTILNDNIPEGLESFTLTVVYSSPLRDPQNMTTEIFIQDDDSKCVPHTRSNIAGLDTDTYVCMTEVCGGIYTGDNAW